MIKYDYCPICKSKDIKIIKEEIYQYPYNIDEGWNEVINKKLRKIFDIVLKDRSDLRCNIYQCNKCNFIFRMPRENPIEQGRKYNLNSKGKPYIYPTIRGEDKTITIREKRVYEIIKKYGNGKTILDVGGCDGSMCSRLKDEYKCHIVDKIEYKKLEGIDYLGEEITDQTLKYDVIMMIHILEHLSYPLEFLEKYKNYLNKDGILLIATPRGYIKEWKARNDPTMHCNYFSMETLRKAITTAGYKTIYDIEYNKDYEELYVVGMIDDQRDIPISEVDE